MSAPQMRSPAPRGNAECRASRKLLAADIDSTQPAAPPDLPTILVATRYCPCPLRRLSPGSPNSWGRCHDRHPG
jgi:hypothetical protein